MNTDLLYDAMNSIDDDLIEDVEYLRSHPQKRGVILLRRIVVVAACLAVTFVGAMALRGAIFPAYNCGLTEAPESDDYNEYTDADDGITVQSELWMAIRIDKWENGTATATVINIMDTESAININQTIEVCFVDISYTTDEEGSSTEEPEISPSEPYALIEEDYPSGSVVYVWGEFDITASSPIFHAYRMSTTL